MRRRSSLSHGGSLALHLRFFGFLFLFLFFFFLRKSLLHNLHQIRMKSIPGTIKGIAFINKIFSEQSVCNMPLSAPCSFLFFVSIIS